VDRDYGVQSRHVNWLSRQFWRIWYTLPEPFLISGLNLIAFSWTPQDETISNTDSAPSNVSTVEMDSSFHSSSEYLTMSGWVAKKTEIQMHTRDWTPLPQNRLISSPVSALRRVLFKSIRKHMIKRSSTWKQTCLFQVSFTRRGFGEYLMIQS